MGDNAFDGDVPLGPIDMTPQLVELGVGLSWDELVRLSRTRKRDTEVPVFLGWVNELVRFPPTPYPVRLDEGTAVVDPGVVARAEEAEKVIGWAFRQFVVRDVASQGDILADAPVWMGDHTRLELVVPEDTSIILAATQRELAEARIEYRGPLEAPIALGAHVADLVIPRDELPDARIALVSERV